MNEVMIQSGYETNIDMSNECINDGIDVFSDGETVLIGYRTSRAGNYHNGRYGYIANVNREYSAIVNAEGVEVTRSEYYQIDDNGNRVYSLPPRFYDSFWRPKIYLVCDVKDVTCIP